MKKLFTLLLCAVLFCAGKVNAQNVDHPWLLGFGIHFVDYTSVDPMLKGIYDFNDFQSVPAFSKFDIAKNLNKSFALELSLAAASVNRYGTSSNGNQFFADVDFLVKYLLANDYLLKSSCAFDPYIAVGPGFSKLGGNSGFAINAGIGTNLWLSETVGIRLQTLYNGSSEDKVGDYFHHTLGLVIRFGSGKDSDKDGVADSEDKCPTVAGLENLMGCPDRDGDGIADNDDACPDVKGLASFKGCPDSDGDGITDKDDACPTNAGKLELNGCPDKDGDGVADKDDKCPDVAGLTTLAGCPDKDGDGIADAEDQCPNEKGTSEMAGCPDRDGDKVADKDDKCPDVKGLKTNNGCPSIDEAKKKEVLERISFAAKSIQFETGKDVIKKVSYARLDTVVSIMKQYEYTNWSIEGHTDNVGKADKNLDLSKRRAAAVKAYFIGKGISEGRLQSEGFGDTKPAADNKTAAGKATNRRVEIKLNE